MTHYHPNPSVGYEPGSPPDEPKFMKPTREDVTAAIRQVAGDVVVDSIGKDPFRKAVLRAFQDLDWTEMLATGRCSWPGGWDAAVLAAVEDLRGEFESVLARTPAEEWPT